jgi:hypothetical protein
MAAERPYLAFVSSRNPRKELEALYARRSVIDDLIRSLEEYNRYRERRLATAERKMA